MKDTHMVLIGSTHKHLGKTSLACKFIHQMKKSHNIAAVKVTPTKKEGFTISDMTQSPELGSDTARMRVAGARPVFWIETHRDKIGEALERLYGEPSILDADIIIIESTSCRYHIEPGLFILLSSERSEGKVSASELILLADYHINTDTTDLGSISISKDSDRFLLAF